MPYTDNRHSGNSSTLKNSSTSPATIEASQTGNGGREIAYELISGICGLLLALFMWGHMFLVGTILFGERGFDWLASTLEKLYIAQPTVIAIFAFFLLHALFASRKIPARLRERRAMFSLARTLRDGPGSSPEKEASSSVWQPHLDSWLWIWQVRTGMIILILGSFHLVLMTLDVFTPMFGDVPGIEAVSSMARVQGGLLLPYAVLLLCVEFHAGAGLYRLAIKWGVGSRFSRHTLWRIEKIVFWVFLVLGIFILLVLAAWLSPPFAGLLD